MTTSRTLGALAGALLGHTVTGDNHRKIQALTFFGALGTLYSYRESWRKEYYLLFNSIGVKGAKCPSAPSVLAGGVA